MTVAVAVNTQKPISTAAELHDHLRAAAQVELSTIPLYLYAMYSIKARSEYQWDPGISAFRTIRSVVIEEMLHLCLARNVLLGSGGEDVKFYDKRFVPTYPSLMLHHSPDLMLQLEPCSRKLMKNVFLPLEMPKAADAPPEPDRYRTLGQFYEAIEDGLRTLTKSDPGLWDNPREDHQYTATYWNQDGGGNPIVVTNLDTALAALRLIVEQGEGAKPGDQYVPTTSIPFENEEYSHYAKFKRIADGIDPIVNKKIDPAEGLWPVPTDPKVHDYEGDVRELAVLFNAAYCYVLKLIDALYATPRDLEPGKTSVRYGLERTFVASMGGLLYPLADLLVRQPGYDHHNAAPTFEFHHFRDGSARQELIDRATALLGAFPALGGPDGLLWLLSKLPEVD